MITKKMFTQMRQLSKWVLRSSPFEKCEAFSRPSLSFASSQNHHRKLSILSSQSTTYSFHNVNNCSVVHKLSPTPLLTNALKSLNVTSVRHYERIYYKPSAWKRYNKHNIEKRLTTDGGLEILWRRVLKGKHTLANYHRVLPNTHNSKILHKHQLRFRKHPLTRHKLPKPGLF